MWSRSIGVKRLMQDHSMHSVPPAHLLLLRPAAHAGHQQANQLPAGQAALSQARRVQQGGGSQGHAVCSSQVIGLGFGRQHLAAVGVQGQQGLRGKQQGS